MEQTWDSISAPLDSKGWVVPPDVQTGRDAIRHQMLLDEIQQPEYDPQTQAEIPQSPRTQNALNTEISTTEKRLPPGSFTPASFDTTIKPDLKPSEWDRISTAPTVVSEWDRISTPTKTISEWDRISTSKETSIKDMSLNWLEEERQKAVAWLVDKAEIIAPHTGKPEPKDLLSIKNFLKNDPIPSTVAQAGTGAIMGIPQFIVSLTQTVAEWTAHPIESWKNPTAVQQRVAKDSREFLSALLPDKVIEDAESKAGQAGAAASFAYISYPIERVVETVKAKFGEDAASIVEQAITVAFGFVMLKGMATTGKTPDVSKLPFDKALDQRSTTEILDSHLPKTVKPRITQPGVATEVPPPVPSPDIVRDYTNEVLRGKPRITQPGVATPVETTGTSPIKPRITQPGVAVPVETPESVKTSLESGTHPLELEADKASIVGETPMPAGNIVDEFSQANKELRNESLSSVTENLLKEQSRVDLKSAKDLYIPNSIEHQTSKLSPRAWKALEEGDVGRALSDFSARFSSKDSPILSAIAKRLQDFDYEGIRIVITSDHKMLARRVGENPTEGQIYGGMFSPGEKTIYMNPRGANSGRTLIHEVVHVLTYRSLLEPRSPKELRLGIELRRILTEYENWGKKNGIDVSAGTSWGHLKKGSNRIVAEFASEVFSNRKVWEKLKDIQDSKVVGRIRTLLNNFQRAIADSLGYNREGSLARSAVATLDELMTEAHRGVSRDALNRPNVMEELNRSRPRTTDKPYPQREERTPHDEKRDAEKVIQLLSSEKQKEAFLMKIKANDIDLPEEQLSKLWDNKDHVLASSLNTPSTHSFQSGVEKALGGDSRSWWQFAKENEGRLEKIAPHKDDILGDYRNKAKSPRSIQITSQTNKGQTASNPFPRIGDEILNFVVEKYHDVTRMWDRIGSEFMRGPLRSGFGISAMREYKKGNTGVFKPIEDLSSSDRRGLMKMYLEMERDPSELVTAGIQWADTTMLQRRGFNPAQINAYKALTSVYDSLYTIINGARAKEGLPPIPKVPGYFPHFIQGRYRVYLAQSGQLVKILPFKSREAAERFISTEVTGNSQGASIIPDTEGNMVRSRSGPNVSNYAAELTHQAEVYMNFGKLGPLIKARINSMIDRAQSARLASAIERTGGPLEYTGKEGINSNADVRKALGIIHQYALSVFEYAKNVDLEADVMRPLKANGVVARLPNLNEWVNNYHANNIGKNPNNAAAFDKIMDIAAAGLNKMTTLATGGRVIVPKGTIQRLIPISNSLLMFSALAANVKFTAVQSMQGIAALTAYLHLLDADMVRLGIKPKTTAIPIEVAFREMFAGFKGESRYFMDYAAKNHITDTALWEIFQRDSLVKSSLHQGINKLIDTLTLRWPAEKLETFNRGFAFLAGAKYARANGFSLEASLRFGNKMTDVIMGNYSKGSRPLFYTNYGAAGHLFSPFSTIMNQYLGNMMHQGININGGKGTRAALVSAGAMGLSYLIFSGLQGLPGIEDYDKVVRFLNGKNINPDEVHFPSWNDVLSDHEIHPAIQYGVPTWVTMLVSEAAGGAPGQGGMNIGSGANAPGISGRFDATTLGASADQALFAWEALKQAYVLLGGSKEHTPNQDTLYKSMKRVAPAPFKALIESQYSYKKGTMPSAQKLDDNLPASTEDWIARFAGGRTPVQQDYINNMNVAESREHERIVNIKNATINISDKMFNPSVPPEIVTKLITEAATKYSADVGTIEKTAMQYHINRNINWREKFILRNSSGSLGGAINISNMPKGVQ